MPRGCQEDAKRMPRGSHSSICGFKVQLWIIQMRLQIRDGINQEIFCIIIINVYGPLMTSQSIPKDCWMTPRWLTDDNPMILGSLTLMTVWWLETVQAKIYTHKASWCRCKRQRSKHSRSKNQLCIYSKLISKARWHILISKKKF